MSAHHYKLDNLVVIIDRNTLQISGRTEDVMGLEPLADKFAAFGCAVRRCNGNDIPALVERFDQLPFETGKPNLLFARTVKGKGVSFIEDAVQWHHKVPNDAEFEAAISELEAAETLL
jgi:transketolase